MIQCDWCGKECAAGGFETVTFKYLLQPLDFQFCQEGCNTRFGSVLLDFLEKMKKTRRMEFQKPEPVLSRGISLMPVGVPAKMAGAIDVPMSDGRSVSLRVIGNDVKASIHGKAVSDEACTAELIANHQAPNGCRGCSE